MMQQLSNDTVIVSTQFSIWESQLPILLANKCCALEDLYLQYAVERISPSTTGEPAAIDGWHVHHCTLSEGTFPADLKGCFRGQLQAESNVSSESVSKHTLPHDLSDAL